MRGLDLVWDSATPPTHIWEISPKKDVTLLLPLLLVLVNCLFAFKVIFYLPFQIWSANRIKVLVVIFSAKVKSCLDFAFH